MPLFSHTSEYSSQVMKVSNNILSKSTSLCIQSCSNTRNDFSLTIIGSNIGTIDASQYCIVQGNGCKLLASLDTTLQNTLTAMSTLKDLEESDLLTALSGISSDTSVSASTDQEVRNNISTVMSSMCRTGPTNTDNNTTFIAIGDNIGTVDLSQRGSDTDNNCFIENNARTNVKNNLLSKIEETIFKGSIFMWIIIMVAAVIAIIVIGIVVVLVAAVGAKAASSGMKSAKAQPTVTRKRVVYK